MNSRDRVEQTQRLRLKLISCEVFVRSACLAIATSPHTVDPVFTPKAAHENAEMLRKTTQRLVDEAETTGIYDAVLVAMGLCGNGIVGIQARTIPVVIPRAHDCCTLFLGSKDDFLREFGNTLSAEWSSAGYMERGDGYLRDSDTGKSLGIASEFDEFVKQYGEENARYIWESLHPERGDREVIFIQDAGIPDDSFRKEAEAAAAESGRGFRLIVGNHRLIRMLIYGEWPEEEFLTVPPGGRVAGVYDHRRVIAVE